MGREKKCLWRNKKVFCFQLRGNWAPPLPTEGEKEKEHTTGMQGWGKILRDYFETIVQLSELSARKLNVQSLVINMTLALTRRDFRGPGQLHCIVKTPNSSNFPPHQTQRLATIVFVELPSNGLCASSEKQLIICIPHPTMKTEWMLLIKPLAWEKQRSLIW